jgi:rhodanese-related sulfurtransferase
VKKARLDKDIKIYGSSAPTNLPKPNFPLPKPDIPHSFSFSGTRQEAQQLTEQLERMKIQEEDEKAEDNTVPSLSKSALFVSHNSQLGRKSLLEQESEERLNQVRQINHMIGPSSATGEASYKVHLPILTKTSQPDLNCITSQTMEDLLLGKFNDHYDAILIIDCRFDYEYDGGHIRGALNFPDSIGLDENVFDRAEYQAMGSRLCLVFHCEFSSHRGPRGYKKFRSLDRKQNADRYPHLDFPEMYLLEGGYRNFWENPKLRSYCEPCGYVEMKATEHIDQCKEAMRPRGRSVSKVTGPLRRHFSMSCSNIMVGAGLTPETLKTPITAREQLRFDGDEPDDDVSLFGGNRHNMSNNR